MLGSIRKSPAQLQALEQVHTLTRERFKLDRDDVVLVTELVCALPGCPPLETVVAFWTDNDRRHHFKVFKPVAMVLSDDLPYAWQKNSLFALEGEGCDCC
jgi:nitrate reductase delta subunit